MLLASLCPVLVVVADYIGVGGQGGRWLVWFGSFGLVDYAKTTVDWTPVSPTADETGQTCRPTMAARFMNGAGTHGGAGFRGSP